MRELLVKGDIVDRVMEEVVINKSHNVINRDMVKRFVNIDEPTLKKWSKVCVDLKNTDAFTSTIGLVKLIASDTSTRKFALATVSNSHFVQLIVDFFRGDRSDQL